MKTFKDLLTELNACKDGIEWVGDKTIEQFIDDCERGDWFLWLAQKIELDKRKIVLAAGQCANTVRQLMGDERSTRAVDVAIAYGNGLASEEELEEAAVAANAAVAAASWEVAAAVWTARAAWAAAAMDADTAAWLAAADAAAWLADEAANRKQTASICREILGKDIIDKVNELLNY